MFSVNDWEGKSLNVSLNVRTNVENIMSRRIKHSVFDKMINKRVVI